MTKAIALLAVVSLLTGLTGWAQNPFLNDANGRPLYLTTNYEADGSPYLKEEYAEAEITAFNGKAYANVRVKLNLETNQLLYLGKGDMEMEAVMPIRRIRFITMMAEHGAAYRTLVSFEQPINAPGSPIYEQLDSGRVTLLRQLKVTHQDNQEFNKATITRHFRLQETFHVVGTDGKIVKLAPGKEAIIALFTGKQPELTAFIEKNRLKCRNAADYRKIVAHYNSLF